MRLEVCGTDVELLGDLSDWYGGDRLSNLNISWHRIQEVKFSHGTCRSAKSLMGLVLKNVRRYKARCSPLQAFQALQKVSFRYDVQCRSYASNTIMSD